MTESSRGRRPVDVADITTPALIVDVPTLDRNIAAMARFFAEGPCRLRPHVKAHKTPEIARRQLAVDAHAHDRSLAELLFDRGEREVDRGVAVGLVVGPFWDLGGGF